MESPVLAEGRLGTPTAPNGTRLLLLGSGELGTELLVEAQRLGVETIAAGRYENAPAMQVAHRSHTLDMTDPEQVRDVVAREEPAVIVPEIEAIATAELGRLEDEGYDVVPTARATRLTMDRQRIRETAAEAVGVATTEYAFAGDRDSYRRAVDDVGLPAVVKPTMSSSGKGQSVVRTPEAVDEAWETAHEESQAETGRVIVEEFVEFDAECTLLTVRHRDGTSVCPPVGHAQDGGDYVESWQPLDMSGAARETAEETARAVTAELGGLGVFGVEFFVSGDDVLFSELSPRPHDTGLVTLASQNLSQFELHLRAVLGLPLPEIEVTDPGASAAIRAGEAVDRPAYEGVADGLATPATDIRLFGKPTAYAGRRMGVAVATADDVVTARDRAVTAADSVRVVDDA